MKKKGCDVYHFAGSHIRFHKREFDAHYDFNQAFFGTVFQQGIFVSVARENAAVLFPKGHIIELNLPLTISATHSPAFLQRCLGIR